MSVRPHWGLPHPLGNHSPLLRSRHARHLSRLERSPTPCITPTPDTRPPLEVPMAKSVTGHDFTQANATASQSSVALTVPGDTGLNGIVMPWPGAILGISVAVENARSGGTATVKPTKNGTESTTLSAVINATNTQYAYATQEKDAGTADKFAAGDRIGAKITTDGSWAAGSTPSIVATVWVQ